MAQQVIGEIDGRIQLLDLPDAEMLVLPGVRWGAFDHALTPAFWVSQAWMMGTPDKTSFKLGKDLNEEVIYCLLGGHGAPAEVGLAAARRVCAAFSNNGELTQDHIEALLTEPLIVGSRQVRYRFAAQRARYLGGALSGLTTLDKDEPSDAHLRNALQKLPGIGPKTASWIVRNYRGSNEVAILDVHIVRACTTMGLFPQFSNLARDYFDLERRFLDFCSSTGAYPSVLDALMWATMRTISRPLMQLLVDPQATLEQPGKSWLTGGQRCRVRTAQGMKRLVRV